MRRLRRVSTVVFDCDSTLSAVEGIDELGRAHRAEIEALTAAAMSGAVPLEQVYGRRLELVRPTRTQLEALARTYIDRLVPDARAVVHALGLEGLEVRIMSGGLRPAVLELAAELGLAPGAVAAVDIDFDESGEYRGFDASSPLARAGGKRALLQLWRGRLSGPVMLVGDGATDLEAEDVADVFVAYAGVVARPPVLAGADVVVRSASLAPVLPLALGGTPPRHAANRALFERGLELLEPEYRACMSNHRT
ncbi:MAG TPA: HAD-IB family phosphatase [Longimicrobiales bacterium]|nr:HAD-IB family phosphatase [Longimicrobiales bacterium]